ncbi:phage tail spike protein [uncultured Lactobacillus sp.]|uniref:phage tail spike protein n=1 Tax=uncultured Lactobacillus sp. TaxID=153152 RepID=UPI002632CB04|nr:phage tail spike protein [uncultured Lactobacillus sp.]
MMINKVRHYPRLYNKASDSLSNMGLGPMKGIKTASVQRDANKVPVLTLTYDKDDILAPELKPGRIIVTSMGPRDDEKEQKFRISQVNGDKLEELSISATHVAGDLAYNVITKDISIANASPETAFDSIKEALGDPLPELSFYSDIPKVANLGWSFKDATAAINLLLGEDQAGDETVNTMQALYSGEWTFDNYKFSLLQHAGQDTGLVVKYGRRLKSLNQDTNVDNTYNAIFPYATYSPDTITAQEGGTPMDGQGVVQYVGAGGAQTFDSPYEGHHVNGHVKNGSYYQVEKKADDNTVNGDTWYLIGNGQWIDEHFFTFDKTGAYVVNKAQGQGTIRVSSDSADGEGLIVDYSGVGTISYSGKGKVALWTSPFTGRHVSGQYVANGRSFKIFAKATDYSGKVWYCLGNRESQWIDSQYLVLTKENDYTKNGTRGILSVAGQPQKPKTTKKVAVAKGVKKSSTRRKRSKQIVIKKKAITAMTGPGTGKQISWSAPEGSRWLITNVATDYKDQTWYQISTYIWVKEDDTISFTQAGTVKPNIDDIQKDVAQKTGKIPIYNAPNGTRVTNQWVGVGTQVPILSSADSNGKTWYEIGEGRWVDADYFTFENPTDVAPGDYDSAEANLEVPVQDVTVTLPNSIVTSPFMDDNERLRIQTVDFSSYNVRDADRLKELADQYIKQYRIGYPNTSMTLDYQQICDEVDLYDLVHVQYEKLNLEQKAEVNSVIWDPLKEEFTQITIGDLPVSYEHILGQYVQKTVQKNTTTLERKSTHLFGQLHQAMKEQGDDQKAAVAKIMNEVGGVKDAVQMHYESTLAEMQKIDSDVSSINEWINSNSGGVIQAIPNWRSPTELVAETGSGGQMKFNANGLQFIGPDGNLRTAIDSEGRIAGEYVDFGRVDALSIKGVDIEGVGEIYSHNNGNSAVMSASGFSASTNNPGAVYTIATNGYDIRLSAGGSEHWFTWNDLYKALSRK